MSGIAGIYHLQTAKPVDPARLRLMANGMSHRGRGGAAEWTAAGVGLSAIGTHGEQDGPTQPLISDDEAATIVYDGILLNSAVLRSSLLEFGHRLVRGDQAELVLAAWRQWGVDCLPKIEGYFAFAIHDHKRGALFLARDRMGARPLHMALLSDGALAFASELGALIRHPLLQRQPNLTAAEDYLALGYVPDDNCLIAGVEKLAAGHYLLVQRGKPVDGPVRWWTPDFSRRVRANEAEASEYLRYLLRTVVREHHAAAPSTGLMLSGGMDSGALLAIMASDQKNAVRAATLRASSPEDDESEAARMLAHRFAASFESYAAPSPSVEQLDHIANIFDEPCADLDVLWLMHLAGEAGQHMDAALLGHGADVIFAGSRRMIYHHGEEKWRGRIPNMMRRSLLGPLSRALPTWDWAPKSARWRLKLSSLSQSGTQAYARAIAYTGPARRVKIFNDAAVRALGHHIGEGRYWREMAGARAREPLDRAQYADWKIAISGDMLMKLDRIGAHQNIALMAPYLDHRIAEFVMALPAHMRVRKKEGKVILRRAVARQLPKSLLDQPRQHWRAPVSVLLRAGLADEARRLAGSATLSHTGWFDMVQIRNLVDAHAQGKADHGALIWQLILMEKALARLFNI